MKHRDDLQGFGFGPVDDDEVGKARHRPESNRQRGDFGSFWTLALGAPQGSRKPKESLILRDLRHRRRLLRCTSRFPQDRRAPEGSTRRRRAFLRQSSVWPGGHGGCGPLRRR
jgi:hypothetical protein